MTGSSWEPLFNDEASDRGLLQVEAMVQQLARERCPDGVCPIEPVLQQCVRDAVHSLWHESRITGYIPVLALKQVQDCIRAGTCEPKGETT